MFAKTSHCVCATYITYFVGDKPKTKAASALQPICQALLLNKQLERITIFCKSYSDVINIHQYFKVALGDNITDPPGTPNFVKCRVVDMFTHCTHPTIKKKKFNNLRHHHCHIFQSSL